MKRYLALFLACLLLFTAACEKTAVSGGDDVPADPPANGTVSDSDGNSGSNENDGDEKPISIRITAAGDNLLHDSVSYTAQQTDGSFDYSVLYEEIADVFQGSDIAFLNQEVMLTGEVSAYPSIAARAECADALKEVGFNVINLATNHSLDRGVSGLETCLQNVHDRKFEAVLGAFRTKEESTQQIILEKQGIRFGFLSYTYGINGSGLPSGKEWMIAKIDTAKIRKEVVALRAQCDYLIVSMHWGAEYQDIQNKNQEAQAQLLAELGVDLVIGTHPHVLQPAVWYDRSDGGKMYCVYSLGNFISNQRKWATMLGGVLDMTLEFDAQGNLLQVVDAGIIPTVTHYELVAANTTRGHKVYLLQDYTQQLAESHGIRNWAGELKLNWLQNHAAAVLQDQQRVWQK